MGVCGAAIWRKLPNGEIWKSTCYDSTLRQTQYELDTEPKDTIKESNVLPGMYIAEKESEIGEPCSDPRECKSHNCLDVCSPDSKEQVCGADHWKHQRPRGIFKSVCYDTELDKTKYAIDTKAQSSIRAFRK